MGPMADVDAVKYRKLSWPAEKRTPAAQPVARRYTEWTTSAHKSAG
jgi:hypothetical protein